MTPESQPLSDEAQALLQGLIDGETLGQTETRLAAIEAPFRERIAELESALRNIRDLSADGTPDGQIWGVANAALANTKDLATPQREPLSVEPVTADWLTTEEGDHVIVMCVLFERGKRSYDDVAEAMNKAGLRLAALIEDSSTESSLAPETAE